MWLVNITCPEDAWKRFVEDFQRLAEKSQGVCITSKKMPDGTRIMKYKVEDVNDAETFAIDCSQLAGFKADFESM